MPCGMGIVLVFGMSCFVLSSADEIDFKFRDDGTKVPASQPLSGGSILPSPICLPFPGNIP